jgi:hypothetical protein
LNEGDQVLSVTDAQGRHVSVQPGEEVQVLEFLALDGLTKTSDAPLFNPVVGLAQVVFAAAEEQAVALDVAACRKALVFGVSGCTVQVFLQAATNTPALHPPLAAGETLEIDLARQAEQLVLVSSAAGSCWVKQLQE